ncbi:hypothetical protein BATDEDRAFT_23491 [Batrachochytrium dendrobatidis JAM81]|uniref:Cilia- and flagella-associated protein 99 n=1 Tax=Batrachochytrium dendrobatidis (strain JAM81 / FGSC 10211) TaxID=684364 RepID=F4NZ68_BATDJ|nr:uncharacterized protein BATDEDRAFT_23491 [Batrachochytrium dendrobatidis JAM81]EGF81837.1 hypothetical protein BATDEDRAFT_23491 [Batrachochytrium dendrobatidis JAM81]|eukprot:XP_006677296.1 hypothetical protein BATDEDRAFT_23491 [Batrachochytrium dendrobatidis JAM81]
MNAKKLIEHTCNILVQHELAHLGIHAKDVKDELFKIGDKAKRDLTQPIVVLEEDILAQYLTENKVSLINEKTFLTETFLGCVKHRKILESTLKLFYQRTGGKYLQNEYYLFAVICYLALWRLDELGFQRFSKFVKCFDPAKMSRLVGFIFSPDNLNTDLKYIWGQVLDHQFLKEHVIDSILRHVSVAQNLLEELCDRADYGMTAKKSEKKPTAIQAFELTKPRPRKLPLPTEKISTIVKAISIPKTHYEDSVEMTKLAQLKEFNRRKLKEQHENAQKSQFKVAIRTPSNKVEQIRQEIEQDIAQKFEQVRIKPRKAYSNTFQQPIQVKLTTAAILREDALVRKLKREEMDSMVRAETMICDPAQFDAWREECKLKEQENKLLELERKRLDVQMTHEDAYVAKQEIIKDNRVKVIEVLALKNEIKVLSQSRRKAQENENKKKIEGVHEIKQGIIKARTKVVEDNTKIAAKVAQESELLLEQAHCRAEEERIRKIELIQQIRLLEKSVPPVGTLQKDVDLTETSGIGLLGEMSIVELQERLVLAKLKEKDEADAMRACIAKHKMARLEQVSQKLEAIDNEREQRRSRRIQKALPNRGFSAASIVTDGSMTESIKELLLDKDSALRSLQEKITKRKAARIAARNIAGINRPTNMPYKALNPQWPKSTTSSMLTRSAASSTGKWDDLDEAERLYVMQREIERQKQHKLQSNYVDEEGASMIETVPIVELKATQI